MRQNEPAIDTVNFGLQLQNYQNVLKVDVQKVTTTRNNMPRAYPIDIDVECDVLKVYRGDYQKSRIRLETSKEEVSVRLQPTFGTYFFFYNSEDETDSGSYLCEFRLWHFSQEYEKYLEKQL
jgi:hypothetical protein